MNEIVLTQKRGKVLEITLNRPRANAINSAMSMAIYTALAQLRDDPGLLCGIITGTGEKIFSAGWDLKAAAEDELSESDYQSPGGFAGITEMWDLNKPVIAAVNGVAVGGGFEIALACDLIVAAEHATFFLPETSLGVMADAGGVQRLPRKLPVNITMELLLTGRKMGAREAAHYGLVNAVVAGDELMDRAREMADVIVAGAPLSVMAIKEVMRGMEKQTMREAFDAISAREYPLHKAMLESEDHDEGPKAFSEKRDPVWKGR
jgi:crotonobetainyl-CoA hydratase